MLATMTASAHSRPEYERGGAAHDDSTTGPEQVVATLRADIDAGEPWYPALLRAIGAWRVPSERVGDRQFNYLVGGEAFDWLLLAERLCDSLAGRVAEEEIESLLFLGRPPDGSDINDEDFRRLIGPAKHRAHLNYLYGVVVEEALQLSVEEDVQKEQRCRVWGHDRREDETVFERIYGPTREALLYEFRSERALPQQPVMSLAEHREFTYWLFKRRVRTIDPARLASDTRRGLARLARLREIRRHHGHAADDEPAGDSYAPPIDLSA